ncbi:hypothetical protein FRC17_009888 [Serendipita sp. 399]|nr:hypothetical protein FRC17_009888 [Serendipita sp. 399]
MGGIVMRDDVRSAAVAAAQERERTEAVLNLGKMASGGRSRHEIMVQRRLSSVEVVATTPRRRKRTSDHLEDVSEAEVDSESKVQTLRSRLYSALTRRLKVTKRARLEEDGLQVYWSPRLGRGREFSAEIADHLENIGEPWEGTDPTGTLEFPYVDNKYDAFIPGNDSLQTPLSSLLRPDMELNEGALMQETVADPGSLGKEFKRKSVLCSNNVLPVADLDHLIFHASNARSDGTPNLADIEGGATMVAQTDADEVSNGDLDTSYATSPPDSVSISSEIQTPESMQGVVEFPRTTRNTRQRRRLPAWAELLAYCCSSQELKGSLESQTSVLKSNAVVFSRQQETEIRDSLFDANGEPKRSEVAGVKAYGFLPENQLPVILDGCREVAAFAAKEMRCNYSLVCRASFSIDATNKTFSYQTSPCKKVLKTDENLVRHIREQHLGIKRQKLGR